jgi:predicted small lipoprotein YifL
LTTVESELYIDQTRPAESSETNSVTVESRRCSLNWYIVEESTSMMTQRPFSGFGARIAAAALFAASLWGCGSGGPQVATDVPPAKAAPDVDYSKQPLPKGLQSDPRIPNATVDPTTGRVQ